MEIKPPGSGKPAFDPSQNTEAVESKFGKFESKLQRTGSDSPSPLTPAVSAFKSRFTKRDLDDSSKRDSILNSAVRELMVDELPQASQLNEADKQFLADWMAKD